MIRFIFVKHSIRPAIHMVPSVKVRTPIRAPHKAVRDGPKTRGQIIGDRRVSFFTFIFVTRAQHWHFLEHFLIAAQITVMIAGIHYCGCIELSEPVLALRTPCPLLGPIKSGQH